MSVLFLLQIVSVIVVAVHGTALAPANNWPIIGVFTQPTTSTAGDCGGNCLYVAASYVKYLESAGARVVPINYHATNAELDTLFNSINGIFFPGGSSSFPSSAQYMFDKVVAANDAGDFFPLWGTCMGFEWLMIAGSRDQNILDPHTGVLDAENYSIPLNFTAAMKDSKLFEHAPPAIVNVLSKYDVTMNNHMYGIYPTTLSSTPALASLYNVLSTNYDRAVRLFHLQLPILITDVVSLSPQGAEFVSTVEAFNYPIFGSQWHPEKNTYEWQRDANGAPHEAINHARDAVLIAQYTANFFVEQARHNFHKFATAADEDKALIYNYTPVKTTGSFVQEYFFHF